jgi:hypothetical protein
MKVINESIDSHGTGRISNCLNRLVPEVPGCATAIIFFCKVKIFPLLDLLSHNIIPHFIKE